MASIRELRQKIKSVKSTQQITKAMKLVAAARLNKAQERILMARPFAEKMDNLLHELAYLAAQNEQNFHHSLMEKRESRRIDYVLITADRGLCGGFNANLIRRTVQLLREAKEKDMDAHLWIVGKKGRDFFRRVNVKSEREYLNIFQRLTFTQAELIGKDLIQHYLNSDTREIVLIYNEFKSRIQQKLTLKTLLPVQPVEGVQPTLDFIYEPNREEILEELLPRHINAQIFRILLESQSAELAARMSAMDNATNNARDMIHSLTLTMNKVRQAAITKELSEIVSGADALQTK